MPISDQGRRRAGARPQREESLLDDLRRPDLALALRALDRATREFARRLGTTADGSAEPGRRGAPSLLHDDALDLRMREAEREARQYLEQAKLRADALVTTMIGAVETETTQMRREAEEGISRRWSRVEADADRHLDEARRVAESMVAERQHRIAVLTEGICSRADALTAGMEDAEEVRRQFESFVRSLSATAGRIAETSAASQPPPLPRLHRRRRPLADDSLAA